MLYWVMSPLNHLFFRDHSQSIAGDQFTYLVHVQRQELIKMYHISVKKQDIRHSSTHCTRDRKEQYQE